MKDCEGSTASGLLLERDLLLPLRNTTDQSIGLLDRITRQRQQHPSPTHPPSKAPTNGNGKVRSSTNHQIVQVDSEGDEIMASHPASAAGRKSGQGKKSHSHNKKGKKR